MDNLTSLRETITRCQSGDTESFRDLYDALSDRVFRFARSRTQNREDALDITQEVFVELWKTLPRLHYRSEGEFYSLIYTITRRKVSRFYRFRRPTVSLEDLGDLEGFDDSSTQSETEEALSLVRTLPSADREAVELRYLAGLPFSEIARVMKSSEGAVKIRVQRALDKLQKKYEGTQ
jgi:RNA polymerase sigma-70 factor (ECF subfamily)